MIISQMNPNINKNYSCLFIKYSDRISYGKATLSGGFASIEERIRNKYNSFHLELIYG